MRISTEYLSTGKKLSRTIITLVVTLLLSSLVPTPAFSSNQPGPTDAGRLSRALANREEIVTVRLVGVTSYETTRLFQNLLNQIDGVIEVKPYRFNLNPDRPRLCSAEWRVRLVGEDLFQLESSLYHRLREIAVTRAGEFPELTRDLTPMEIKSLGFIEPRQAGARFLTFVQVRRVADNQHPSWPDCSRGCCPVDSRSDSFNHGFE